MEVETIEICNAPHDANPSQIVDQFMRSVPKFTSLLLVMQIDFETTGAVRLNYQDAEAKSIPCSSSSTPKTDTFHFIMYQSFVAIASWKLLSNSVRYITYGILGGFTLPVTSTSISSYWRSRQRQSLSQEQFEFQPIELRSDEVLYGVIGAIGNESLNVSHPGNTPLILGKAEFVNPGRSVKDRVALLNKLFAKQLTWISLLRDVFKHCWIYWYLNSNDSESKSSNPSSGAG
ncbi:uncharacterized protein EDB91DRAFT_1340427, partial [Suillus paluster]|uniref:uncharacterized protein n=1 Tax=Suillus paluster TaxID=48578 RepID=UPI001B8822F9